MRPAKNKTAIVDASLELFCKKGFSDSSIKEITELAGVSPGNVYNHFDTKEEIFDHIFREYFPGSYVKIFINGVSDKKDFDENIEIAIRNIIEFVETNPYFFKLVLIDANEFEGRYLKKYSEPFAKPIEEYFDEPSNAPTLRNDIGSVDFTGFFAWLFYSIGMTDIIYTNNIGHSFRFTQEYQVLLKVLKRGLKGG